MGRLPLAARLAAAHTSGSQQASDAYLAAPYSLLPAPSSSPLSYNFLMTSLALPAMRILEVLFFTGLAGAAVVIVISFIQDGKELLGRD
jgi:hypothetical protein